MSSSTDTTKQVQSNPYLNLHCYMLL